VIGIGPVVLLAGSLQVGLRTGYGLPIGGYAKALELQGISQRMHDLGDDANGAIPIWIEAGYRIVPELSVGGYALYGMALFKAADRRDPLGGGCPEGVDCAAWGWRFGLRGEVHLLPHGAIDPWAGIGVGYELLYSDFEGTVLGFPMDVAVAYRGFELLLLEGGADVRVWDRFAVGPFLSLSLVQYSGCSAERDGESQRCEITRPALHEWLVIGVRGTLGT
jgi:hypothetical protein